MKLVAIILTLNEERHLRRCIESIEGVVDEVVVMDCYSTDDTLKTANELGARVLQRAWVNYATQFNYALTQVGEDVDWLLRIDADEYLTPALAAEIIHRTNELLPAERLMLRFRYLWDPFTNKSLN